MGGATAERPIVPPWLGAGTGGGGGLAFGCCTGPRGMGVLLECCWCTGVCPFEGLLEEAGGRGGPWEGFRLPFGGPGLALGGVSEGVEFYKERGQS